MNFNNNCLNLLVVISTVLIPCHLYVFLAQSRPAGVEIVSFLSDCSLIGLIAFLITVSKKPN